MKRLFAGIVTLAALFAVAMPAQAATRVHNHPMTWRAGHHTNMRAAAAGAIALAAVLGTHHAAHGVHHAADSSTAVASDNLALMEANWACGPQQAGATVGYLFRFTFTSGGVQRVGYQAWRTTTVPKDKPNATLLETCSRQPTNAQLGLS